MTASQLIQEINADGGRVELAPHGQIRVTHAPRRLAPELKRLKLMIIRHLEEENFRRLSETFNLKEVTPPKMREITGGQPWRILNTRPHPTKSARESWLDGPRCPACRGTWHSQKALAEHLLGCRVGQGELGKNQARRIA